MPAKILVVDESPSVQRLLQYTLKQEGYDVVVASDGAEGFRLWGAEAPDLILLDVMLPKLDGYQVAAKIRSEEGSASHVPIIMLTAEREVEQKVRGLRAGADDYLIKPFHPAELLARIKSLLARFAPRESLLARPPLGRVLAFYGAKAVWAPRRSRSTRRSLSTVSSAGRSRWSMAISSSATTVSSSTWASTERASSTS